LSKKIVLLLRLIEFLGKNSKEKRKEKTQEQMVNDKLEALPLFFSISVSNINSLKHLI
jgi:hypothetical protein